MKISDDNEEELASIINFKIAWFIRWGMLIFLIFICIISITIFTSPKIIPVKIPGRISRIDKGTICIAFHSDSESLIRQLQTQDSTIMLICSDQKMELQILQSQSNCFIIKESHAELLKSDGLRQVQIEIKADMGLIFGRIFN